MRHKGNELRQLQSEVNGLETRLRYSKADLENTVRYINYIIIIISVIVVLLGKVIGEG